MSKEIVRYDPDKRLSDMVEYAGILYLAGALLMAFNLWKTIKSGAPVMAQAPAALVAEAAA